MCEPSPNGFKLFLSEIYEKYARWATAEHGVAESREKLAHALLKRGFPNSHSYHKSRFELRIRSYDDDD